jgi:hypothetical protein
VTRCVRSRQWVWDFGTRFDTGSHIDAMLGPMPSIVVVSVPEGDAEDLNALQASFIGSPHLVEAHPFDGEALAQMVGALGTGGLGALTVWLRARAEQRKHFRVSFDGLEITGYGSEEAERIIRMLKEREDSHTTETDQV